MKKFNEYMPKKRAETELLQAKVNKDLKHKVGEILDKEHWTWIEFLEGVMHKFLDENGSKRSAG